MLAIMSAFGWQLKFGKEHLAVVWFEATDVWQKSVATVWLQATIG
jgi:hypothetical protein